METYAVLPKKLFKVRVPRLATMSQFELEMLGMPVSYRDGEDIGKVEADINERELVTAMYNIDSLINLYIDGNPIRLCNDNDIIELYDTLETYLNNTTDISEWSPNRKLLKEKRADDIDSLLQEMFGYNKAHIAKKSVGIGGYDLGLGFMNKPSRDATEPARRVGLMAAYDDNAGVNKSYITNNLPELDLSKFKRRSHREQFN